MPVAGIDLSLAKVFPIKESLHAEFRADAFNALNHAMFATSTPGTVNSGSLGTFFATPDVGTGLNPVLGTGAQRNMQFGLAVDF